MNNQHVTLKRCGSSLITKEIQVKTTTGLPPPQSDWQMSERLRLSSLVVVVGTPTPSYTLAESTWSPQRLLREAILPQLREAQLRVFGL